jgi:hypothetical protein
MFFDDLLSFGFKLLKPSLIFDTTFTVDPTLLDSAFAYLRSRQKSPAPAPLPSLTNIVDH